MSGLIELYDQRLHILKALSNAGNQITYLFKGDFTLNYRDIKAQSLLLTYYLNKDLKFVRLETRVFRLQVLYNG